jgi:hypothetical protein
MSEEQLKSFLEVVKADAGLQEKLKAADDAEMPSLPSLRQRASCFLQMSSKGLRRRFQKTSSKVWMVVVCHPFHQAFLIQRCKSA